MKSNASEIFKEYETTQRESENLQRQRTEEIYNKFPRIKDIDLRISSIGFEIASSIFKKEMNGMTIDEFVDSKKDEIEKLKSDKTSILIKNGYSRDYLERHYNCAKCKDTGYIGQEKCPCFRQKLINLHYRQSNLTNVLKRENFDNFNFNLYSNLRYEEYGGKTPQENIQGIYKMSVDFATKFDTIYANLLFVGNSGLGKTFLCNCIAKDVLQLGRSVVYNTASNLLENIKRIKFSNSIDNSELETILNCDLLIIDDLGVETQSAFSQSEIFNIINERLLRRKKLIISTNISLEGLQDIYPERIISRLIGNFHLCEFFGDDIRFKLNSEKNKKN